MQQKVWNSIDAKIQSMIAAGFEMAGIQFERDFVDNPENAVEPTIDSPWLTREEAATYAKVSKDTVDNWIKSGYIRYIKTAEGRPGRILIDKCSLEKFLRSKVVNPKKRVRKLAPSVPGGYRVQSKKD